jgi:hypothetical protein
VVRPIVELNHREQALVVAVALGEPASTRGVMVDAHVGQPVVLLVLERVVQQRNEAQVAPA